MTTAEQRSSWRRKSERREQGSDQWPPLVHILDCRILILIDEVDRLENASR